MPAKAARSPVQSHRHADGLVRSQDVEGCPVDFDVEIDLLLGPQIMKLTAKVRGRHPFIEGANCAAFWRLALGEKLVDVDQDRERS